MATFLITTTLMALTGWLSFELGRKWDQGEREAAAEAEAERRERGGVKLRRITIRR